MSRTWRLITLFLAFASALSLFAQTDSEEEKVIPTEVSEPPYEIGDLVVETGYYIDQGPDNPKINLRIEDSKFRLYWIDSDGLIAEPAFREASIRLRGSVRGRPYHYLSMMDSGAGLGADTTVRLPHIFNLVLALIPSDPSAEPVSHAIRYTSALDVEVDPTTKIDL